MTALSQTGARLVHDGQLEGRTRAPAGVPGGRPDEPADPDLKAFYERLLTALGDDVFRDGEWHLGGRSGWDGNDAWENLVAWGWRGESRKLVVVNLSGGSAAGHVSLPWDELRGRAWQLDDAAGGERYERSGDDLRDGLYVALEPWSWHLFDLTPLDPGATDMPTTVELPLAEATAPRGPSDPDGPRERARRARREASDGGSR